MLLQISGARLIFGGSYTVASGVVDYVAVAPTNKLTHVAGATHTGAVDYTTRTTTQLWPSIRKIRVPIASTPRRSPPTDLRGQRHGPRDLNVMAYDRLYDLAKANVGVSYTAWRSRRGPRVQRLQVPPGGRCRVRTELIEIAPTQLNVARGIQSYPPNLPALPAPVTCLGWVGRRLRLDRRGQRRWRIRLTYIYGSDAPNGAPFSMDVVTVGGGVTQFGWVVGYLPYGVRGDETSRNATRATSRPTRSGG